MTAGIVILAIVTVAGLYIIGLFNKLVRANVLTSNAWSDIDVALKRRYNLIPNLVETVKGYADFERATLEAVVDARAQAMANTGPPESQAATENMLSGALKSLFALAEGYPDLKASTNFVKLQDDLADTENRIASARRFYNGAVRELNTKVDQFPSNLVAKAFHFAKAQFFTLDDDAAREPVKVAF